MAICGSHAVGQLLLRINRILLASPSLYTIMCWT